MSAPHSVDPASDEHDVDVAQTVWRCEIGSLAALDLPAGADFPMRQAIRRAFFDLVGGNAQFIFSGWGAKLTGSQLDVVLNRAPLPSAPSPEEARPMENATAALAELFNMLARRDPSVRQFYDTPAFGTLAATVYAALGEQEGRAKGHPGDMGDRHFRGESDVRSRVVSPSAGARMNDEAERIIAAFEHEIDIRMIGWDQLECHPAIVEARAALKRALVGPSQPSTDTESR